MLRVEQQVYFQLPSRREAVLGITEVAVTKKIETELLCL